MNDNSQSPRSEEVRSPTATRRWIFAVLALLALAGIIFSSILIDIKLELDRDPTVEACAYAKGLGCQGPNTSTYSEIFKIPVAYYGALTYAVMLALALAGLVFGAGYALPWTMAIAAFNVLYSVFLFYISLTRLDSVCPWCAALYGVNAAQLAASLAGYRTRPWRAPAAAWRSFAARPKSALVFIAAAFAISLAPLAGWRIFYQKPIPVEPGRQEYLKNWQAKPPFNINENTGRRLGTADAPVLIVEYTDFRCPYCRQASLTLKELKKEYGDALAILFKDFPLDMKCNRYLSFSVHADACNAHLAAGCAAEQNAFWSMHNLLFSINDKMLISYRLRLHARTLGLDVDKFDACFNSQRPAALIAATIDEGMKLKVMSTPTLFVNNRRIDGAAPLKQLEWIIDWELEAKGAPLPPGRLKKLEQQAAGEDGPASKKSD